MLNDRNLMSHTYREQLSKQVTEKVISQYVDAFSKVLDELSQRFSA